MGKPMCKLCRTRGEAEGPPLCSFNCIPGLWVAAIGVCIIFLGMRKKLKKENRQGTEAPKTLFKGPAPPLVV